MIKSANEIKREKGIEVFDYQALEDDVMKYIEKAIEHGDESIRYRVHENYGDLTLRMLVGALENNRYRVKYDIENRMLDIWW